MNSAALLAKENNDLHAANEKQKQKRTRSSRQIPHEGGLSVEEAHAIISGPIEAQIARMTPLINMLHHLYSHHVHAPHGDVKYAGSQDIEETHVQIGLGSLVFN